MTSLVSIKYSDIVIEASCIECMLFFFCGQKDFAQIPFTVYGDKWLLSFWGNEESARWLKRASDNEAELVVSQWLQHQPAWFFASGNEKLVDRWDKCLNEFWRYFKNGTLILTFKCTTFDCCSCLFSHYFLCVITRKLWKKSTGRNIALTLCSEYKFSHNNDVIFKKVPVKFLVQHIFWTFHVQNSDRVTPSYDLFMKRPI